MHRIPNNPLGDSEVGEFLASFAMLLGKIKLRDDVLDSRSWLAKIGLFALRKQFAQSSTYFASLDSRFESKVEAILKEHAQLEKQSSEYVSLSQFQEATSRGFEFVFKLFADRFELGAPAANALQQIGYSLGAAIIAFDCATDWRTDQRTKSFNPLRSPEAVGQAIYNCKSRMSEICSHLRNIAPESSLSAEIIQSTFRRLCQLRSQKSDSVVRRHSRGQLALRRGDCDCCCPLDACSAVDCGGCESCGCDGGAVDGPGTCEGDCCQGGFAMPGCDACCFAADCCGTKRRRQQSNAGTAMRPGEQPNADEMQNNLVGVVGQTVGPLNPSGVVQLRNHEYPAVSENGAWIDSSVDVKVVAQDGFGLQVRPTIHRSDETS